MKVLKLITILFIVHAISSCNRKTKVDTNAVKVEDIAIEQVVEDVQPPPPSQLLTSSFKTVKEWLSNICKTEKPGKSIIAYNFALFESKDNYTLSLTGSKHNASDDTVTIDFKPSMMYYQLPQSDYKNLQREQVQNKVTSQLKEFTKTDEFQHSFFTKAKAIIIDFNGENLIQKN